LKRIPVKVNEFKGVIATGARRGGCGCEYCTVPAESFQVLKRVYKEYALLSAGPRWETEKVIGVPALTSIGIASPHL